MKAKVIFLALRVALLTILVWAVSLTPTLAGGGTVTFNCSTALIHLSSTKTISANTMALHRRAVSKQSYCGRL